MSPSIWKTVKGIVIINRRFYHTSALLSFRRVSNLLWSIGFVLRRLGCCMDPILRTRSLVCMPDCPCTLSCTWFELRECCKWSHLNKWKTTKLQISPIGQWWLIGNKFRKFKIAFYPMDNCTIQPNEFYSLDWWHRVGLLALWPSPNLWCRHDTF